MGEWNPKAGVRMWPGVAAITMLMAVRYGLPAVAPEQIMPAVLGEVVGATAVLVWWMFFSRWPRGERFAALALITAALFATRQILDPSIATGMMGMMFVLYAIPVAALALVAGAAAGSRLTANPRRAVLSLILLAGCGALALVRTEGVYAAFHSQFAWRWSKTAEEKLLTRADAEPAPQPVVSRAAAPAIETPPPKAEAVRMPISPAAARSVAEWPGFRGPHRDDIVSGIRIATDWTSAPPVELWSRAVGPGWSSFAAGNGFLYTQEQRGAYEVVACYRADTGKPVWVHRDAARFWESNAGAGPRATPALRDGRVYSLGATGILNALDAATGAVVWTRNAASDAGVKVPTWGFAGSPLALEDEVVVAVAGRLAAYDLAAGKPTWTGPDGGTSYSSPQLITLDGVAQIVLLSDAGATSVAPADGSVLWKHSWRGSSILQPALSGDGGVLISAISGGGAGIGTRRLAVTRSVDEWSAREVWTSNGLKPYFNDFVVHDGHAYGFDGSILSCIDLQDGKRKWKGGRYGNGQMLLLRDQGLLLILSEDGELALVSATSDRFIELAKSSGIEGKTWNHPALAGGVLLVRNDREMAAFRLPVERH